MRKAGFDLTDGNNINNKVKDGAGSRTCREQARSRVRWGRKLL